jgi:hypothetical protein
MLILGQEALKYGGRVVPLILPIDEIKGPTSTNVSVISINNKLVVNIRNLNYFMYHADKTKNPHAWGPLLYIHPEADRTLTTYNYLCELDDDYNITAWSWIDTSELDVKPIWEFIGLEDGRLIIWDNKFFICGVRRDTTTIGVGRMELSELSVEGNSAKEISRVRIPAPSPDKTYCEKNWMPVMDKPYHFVKWSNPTELVRFDPETKQTHTVLEREPVELGTNDLRGGSQIIPYKDHYICIIHEVGLYQTQTDRKDGYYWHRCVIWDKDFNLLRVSEPFTFMDGKIEFCVGLTEHKNSFVVTFGFLDNAAYLIEIPKHRMDKILEL